MRFFKIDNHIVSLRNLVDIQKCCHEDNNTDEKVYYIKVTTLVSNFNILYETQIRRDKDFAAIESRLFGID